MLWLQSKTKNNKIPVRARNVFLEYHCQYWKYILAGCSAIVVLRYKDHVWTWSRGHLCDHLTPLASEPGSRERLSATKQSPLGEHSGGSPSGSPLHLTWASWTSHLASQCRAGEDKVGMSATGTGAAGLPECWAKARWPPWSPALCSPTAGQPGSKETKWRSHSHIA